MSMKEDTYSLDFPPDLLICLRLSLIAITGTGPSLWTKNNLISLYRRGLFPTRAPGLVAVQPLMSRRSAICTRSRS